MAVATYEDVGVALGRSISDPDEMAQIDWWLSGVEIIIGARLGDVTELDQTVLFYVEVEAVAEKVRHHGQSESSITVSVDDGSVTRRYENPVSASDINDQWWQLLDPNSSTATASIRPSFEADDVWWSVSTPPSPYTDPGWTLLP